MSLKWSDAVPSRTPSPTDLATIKSENVLAPSRTPSPGLQENIDSENGSQNRCEEKNENFNSNIRKRKCSTASSSSSDSKKPLTKIETDPVVLARRQKDIDYGKNTIGYDNYVKQVPKISRTDLHPKTPPMYKKMSRRNWDATVKKWRISLHNWDPEELKKLAEVKKTVDSVDDEKKSTDLEKKIKIEIESDSMEESQQNTKVILEEHIKSEVKMEQL